MFTKLAPVRKSGVAIEKAKTEASKPENRRKLDDLRRRYLNKDKRR